MLPKIKALLLLIFFTMSLKAQISQEKIVPSKKYQIGFSANIALSTILQKSTTKTDLTPVFAKAFGLEYRWHSTKKWVPLSVFEFKETGFIQEVNPRYGLHAHFKTRQLGIGQYLLFGKNKIKPLIGVKGVFLLSESVKSDEIEAVVEKSQRNTPLYQTWISGGLRYEKQVVYYAFRMDMGIFPSTNLMTSEESLSGFPLFVSVGVGYLFE